MRVQVHLRNEARAQRPMHQEGDRAAVLKARELRSALLHLPGSEELTPTPSAEQVAQFKDRVHQAAGKCVLSHAGKGTSGVEVIARGYWIWWCKTHHQPWAWCHTDIAVKMGLDALATVSDEVGQLINTLHGLKHMHRPNESVERKHHVDALNVGLQMAINELCNSSLSGPARRPEC